ncbi:uncharacterized protein LOC110886784 isoform X2 [Helianthus annuus]|uniref:uncharacterized protein LOC110886784 isoform X2 n=1 Tax=Helianthus annuus TaxID=4232 RepID=UPI001652BD89|nr:uncharacterized protein LOC110886784 isoform X2 [Helianthus annuus]
MHLKEIEVYWDLISCFLKYVVRPEPLVLLLLIEMQCHFICFEEIRSRKLMLASGLDYFHIHVAYDLLKEYSELARTKYIRAPLWCIAKKWDTYPSAQRYNFYQRFVYFHVPIDNKGVDQTNKINDIENQEICMSNLITQCTKSYVYPVVHRIYVKFWKVVLLHVPYIKHLQEDKEKHNIARETQYSSHDTEVIYEEVEID